MKSNRNSRGIPRVSYAEADIAPFWAAADLNEILSDILRGEVWNRRATVALAKRIRAGIARVKQSVETLAPAERAEHYRQLANEVSQLAKVARTDKAKRTFRDLARRWLALAAEVERYDFEDSDGILSAAIN